MIKYYLRNIALLFTGLVSSAPYAHTGLHTDMNHAHGSIDLFLIVLIVGLLVSVVTYQHLKK